MSVKEVAPVPAPFDFVQLHVAWIKEVAEEVAPVPGPFNFTQWRVLYVVANAFFGVLEALFFGVLEALLVLGV